MKKSVRIFVLVLAVLMILPLVAACGKDKGEQGAQAGNNGNVVTTAPGADNGEYVSKLPTYDWDGDIFYILGREDTNGGQGHNFEIWRSQKAQEALDKRMDEMLEASK